MRKNRKFKTKAEFVQAARKVHGSKYDYAPLKFKALWVKGVLLCSAHGEFEIMLGHHLGGRGCQKCSQEARRMTYSDFVAKARATHGKRYIYPDKAIDGAKKPALIVCRIHGDFYQSPSNHINGQNCPSCSRGLGSTEGFIKKAKEAHGERYDYSKTRYYKSRIKVSIACRIHGEFEQYPYVHTSGSGCPECAGYTGTRTNTKLTNEEFIGRSIKRHGERYDYSKVDYKGSKRKVTIICRSHGEFEQLAASHMRVSGCPKCAQERVK